MVGIAFALIKEILLGVIGKVAFKAIGERFATRLVVYGLNKLKEKNSNTVVQDTVNDIIASLEGKGLKVIDNG